MKKILFFASLLSASFLEALDFGGIGNVSAGMGGAGVALTSSPYGLYYNPALLSADNKTKFGYSLGIQYREKNISKLVGIDLKNIASSPQDLNTLKEILKDNNLGLTSQNGIVFQLSSAVVREEFGSLALGLFGSLYGSVSLSADPNRLDLIVQNGSDYNQLIPTDSGFSIQKSSLADFQAHSLVYALENGVHKIIASSFVLLEVPIGYSKTFYFKNSNLNLGIAAKYLNGIFAAQEISLNTNLDSSKELKKFSGDGNYQTYSNFGIDLGAMYEIDFPDFRYLTFGIVAKNLNYPTFKFSSRNITVKPQYRVGIAYNEQYFTLAFDADILPNELLSFSYEKQQSQMFGGGVKFDLKYVDLRLGAMGDIRQNEGVIFTGGLNILGLFDIALQSGAKFEKNGNYKIPRYFNIKIGGSFSF